MSSSKTKEEERDVPWSKSTIMSQQHKVRLTCADSNTNNNSLVVSLSPEMTLQDLVDAARKLLGSCSGSSSNDSSNTIELTLMGVVPRQLVDLSNLSVKARSVVPHMGRIQVSHRFPKAVVTEKENDKKRPHHSISDESNNNPLSINDDSSSTKKKRTATGSNTTVAVAVAAEAIVDLTGTSDDDDDEEQERHDNHAVASSSDTAIDLTTDTAGEEALARRLQQEQYQEADDDDDGFHVLAPSDSTDPTTVKASGEYWIFEQGPAPYCKEEEAYGKWLLYSSESKINTTWQGIRQAVASGRLHAHSAKVSTKFGVQQKGNGPYVICVFSSKDRMDDVGTLLVRFGRYKQHSISYKTNDRTDKQDYGEGTTIKTMKWPLMTPIESRKKAVAAGATSNVQLSTTTTSTIFLTMVGMKYNGVKPAQHSQLFCPDVTRVWLYREKDNQYDSNAIRVDFDAAATSHGKSTTTRPNQKKKIGHVCKEQAALLAPWLDRGLVEICVNAAAPNNDSTTTNNNKNTVHRLVGETAIELSVRVRACRTAQEMLDAV